jgi:hypothetical protein
MCRIAALCLAAFSLADAPASAVAWSAPTHRLIAARAAERVGGPLGALLLAHRRELLAGAVAPDTRGLGGIPASDHIFHPGESNPLPGAPARAASMMWALANRGPVDPASLAFEFGRVCHLVADLAQPLHTDGGAAHPREKTYHSRFERDVVASAAALCFPPLLDAPAAVGVDAFLRRLATEAHRLYGPLETAYLDGEGFPAVEGLALQQVLVAVAATVSVWRSHPQGRTDGLPASGWQFAGRYSAVLLGYLTLCRPRRAWLRRTWPSSSEVSLWNRWFQEPR